MLLAIRNFIQVHRVVSAEQLSREFRVAPEALNPILDIWINKGVLRQSNSKSCGTSCKSCHRSPITYYEFVY